LTSDNDIFEHSLTAIPGNGQIRLSWNASASNERFNITGCTLYVDRSRS
jgi:hypothetical protein